MSLASPHILLADDDFDDCMIFNDALARLNPIPSLTEVHDGVELMEVLNQSSITKPDVLFLDLNMPKKSGQECLDEIRSCEKYHDLPIVIFSTSFDLNMVNSLHEKGATFYIRKPGEFNKVRKVIQLVLSAIENLDATHVSRENFVIEA